MRYELDGSLLELCTCGGQCYCRPQGDPDGMDCLAANAWHITRGSIDGVDVSGLTVLALSQVHGHILAGRPVTYYVDDGASTEQERALVDAFSGKLGGPLADFAQLTGEVTGVERAAMTFGIEDGQGHLRVGEVVAAQLAPDGGGAGPTAESSGDICTTAPGSRTEGGRATSIHIDAPVYDARLALRDYPVLHGRFHFEG